MVAFSTTDLASFKAVERWIGKVRDQCDNIPMVLVQNKVDLIDQAVMTKEEYVNTSRPSSIVRVAHGGRLGHFLLFHFCCVCVLGWGGLSSVCLSLFSSL